MLSSCFYPTNVLDGDFTEKETTAENNIHFPNSEDTTTTTVNITEELTENNCASKMDIESYMQYFVNYFHEPYSLGDDLSGTNLLSLSFLVSFNYRDNLDFVKTFEEDQVIVIKNSGLKENAALLFGDDVDISSFLDYLADSNDIYNSDEDNYIVFYAKGYWGGDNYYLDEDTPLEIMETDTIATVVAKVYYQPTLGVVENMRTMEYTFEKVTLNGMLFYRIYEVKEVK